MNDQIDRQQRFVDDVMAACERAAFLCDVPVGPVKEEALRLIRNPQLAPEFTPERIEAERQVLYDAALKRGIPLEDVRQEIDELVDNLIAAVCAK